MKGRGREDGEGQKQRGKVKINEGENVCAEHSYVRELG